MSLAVVLINFNNDKYIRRAIESVLQQSVLPDEFIISDDGSSDSSLRIIEEYVERFDFIRLILTPERLGAAGNRHFAIKHVKSEYFINIDSDDFFMQGHLSRLRSAIEGSIDSIFISDFEVVSVSEEVLLRIDTSSFVGAGNNKKKFILASRRRDIPGNQFACSISTYKKIGGHARELRLYEDWDFYMRALLSNVNWVHVAGVGFAYRKTFEGLSSAKQFLHIKYKLKVIFGILVKSRFNFFFIAGFIWLVISKGLRYLSGMNSAIGYN